jgi:ribonuclease Z
VALTFQVLGGPHRDNALLVRLDSGQAVSRLLFDCGDGCLWDVPLVEAQAIDHLFLSHLHIDHIAGFDAFFRCPFGRTGRTTHVWGPPRTAEVLHHRFQGFLWNWRPGWEARWLVHDLHSGRVETHRFDLADAFTVNHLEGVCSWQDRLVEGADFVVEAQLMDHGTPSVAYVVRETPRLNIDLAKVAALGLQPGSWLKQVRQQPRTEEPETLVVGGTTHRLADLREALLVSTPGESVAYLTDFLLDEAALERLAGVLRCCTTVVCESQYRHEDVELATRNYHMTATQAATLALRAGVGRLVLFHLSDRYRPEEWREMLAEAQAVFPATSFPQHWDMGNLS